MTADVATMARFRDLRTLLPDWDGYGAAPIDPAAIDRAERFLQRVAIVPCTDGSVQVEWHTDGVDLEIDFEPDGTTTAYLRKTR